MNIVILDDYQDCVRHLACFPLLAKHQVSIFNDTVKSTDALVARLHEADAVVLTRERTRITAELLARLPTLKLIAQTGKAGNHIDHAACAAQGITIVDSKGSGTATAELTLLLILASLRHFVSEVNRLQQGQWQGSVGRQLAGKTVGVLGYGRIAQQVCQLLDAFGAQLLVWGRDSTLLKAQADGRAVAASRADFFAQCDVLTIQLRLTPETQSVIKPADLALMKRDAVLINTSRAELIEPHALYKALQQGRPGYAAVDVYEAEPIIGFRDPLQSLPNCLCSPHLGFVEQSNYEQYFGAAFAAINAFAENR